MSTRSKEFSMMGVAYRTTQFPAMPALELMKKQEELHPCEMLGNTFAKQGENWLPLSDPDNINELVVDKAGILAPRLVLNALLSIVNEFNFEFMYTWKGAKIPRRFIDDANSVASNHVDPMIAQLLQNDCATLRELEEYYSLEDAFKMFDVMVVKGINSALSQEHASKNSKKN